MPEATKGNCLCVLVPEAQAVHQEDGPQKRNPNTCHRRRYELSRVIRPGRFRMCANEWGCKTVIVQDVWPVLGFSVDTHGIGKPFFQRRRTAGGVSKVCHCVPGDLCSHGTGSGQEHGQLSSSMAIFV